MIRFEHYAQFYTVTNLNWLPVLQNELHKEIIIEAFRHRVKLKQVTIYAFVIMPNHIHSIWQLHDGIDKVAFQRDLLKFTARSMLKNIRMKNDPLLYKLKVRSADREYQVWERKSLSIDLWNEKIFLQKLNYIHKNPIQAKWKLSPTPEDYAYSSAKFYETGKDEFGFLEHFRG